MITQRLQENTSTQQMNDKTVCWTCFHNTKRLEHDCKHIQALDPNHQYDNVISFVDRKMEKERTAHRI
jgi:hypothetical protein